MSTDIYDLFVKPTEAYRGKPFWSWNGELNQEELFRQIQVFKEMGLGGFFMHSRTGLITEYLGEQWFELIKSCAQEAERLGLEAWLYDEDRWPSGTAGGLVTQEPRYRLKFIYLQVETTAEFKWQENTIAAFVCRLEGLAYYDSVQLKREELPEAGSKLSVLSFSIVEMEQESFYNGFTYVDTMNAEATERFLELTHEKYKKYVGAQFGSAIKGIFTDEPHRGALMDGFGINNANHEWHAPWTYKLFEKFEEQFGYDLIPKLPELFLWPEGKKISQVKWHYVELLQQLFIDNYAKPMDEWCRKNNLVLTGHVLHEDNLTAQVAMNGSVMRFYEHMEYPGIDILTESNKNYWVAKQLSSVARQIGRKWLLSELYGCTGWQMPFEAHKSVGDWQALLGINLRCHHLSWYTMEGESKRDFPASISHQSAWWKDYEYVETYFSRLGVVMTNGKPICNILVINPVESLWCQVYPGWSRGLAVKSPEVIRLEQIYADTFHWLAGAQLDFDYGDEEMMGRLCKIAQGADGEPNLHFGEAVYKTVVVSGMVTMRATTLQILQEFVEAGGKVIFMGEPPAYVDALLSGRVVSLAEHGIKLPIDKEALVAACYTAVGHKVTVKQAATGERIEDIFCQVRSDESSSYIVLLNTNRIDWHRNVVVEIQAQGAVEEWFCVSGERLSVNVAKESGVIRLIVDFPPSGEHIYVLIQEQNESVKLAQLHEDQVIAQLEGPFAYTLEEPNVCVLDRAAYRLDSGEWQAEREILKTDQALRTELGIPFRAGDMVQPWYAEKHLANHFQTLGKLQLRYEFTIGIMPVEAVYLVMERPERFKVSLNGRLLTILEVPEWWIDLSLKKIPVPSEWLSQGENAFTLEIDFHPGIDLEAIYLIGMFGVALEGSCKRIVTLPQSLNVGSITDQGLPFYSGGLTYHVDKQALAEASAKGAPFDKEAAYMLALPGFEAACVKVKSNLQAPRMLAWQPFEADITAETIENEAIDINVVLTRRNTFGPLHQLPLFTPQYGPGNFTTEGANFSEDYQLVPAGLTQYPQMITRKVPTAPLVVLKI